MVQQFFTETAYIDFCDIDHVHAKAFLTLPLLQASISSSPGPEAAYFSICNIIDPSALRGLSESQIRQFKTATNILHLHPYHSEEDEILLEDTLSVRRASISDGDSSSGRSEDGDNDSEDANSDAVTSRDAVIQRLKTLAAQDQGSDHPDDERNTFVHNPKLGTMSGGGISHKKEVRPQLMVLGCGKLKAYDLCVI